MEKNTTRKAYRPYSAARFRERSHESAHAQAEADLAANNGPILEHALVSHGPPELINQQDQLLELLKHLRESGTFAYDSEFIGELTYVPKLCLIQVASSKRVALIDALANLDLVPFWQLLCDPSVEKIVHAGQQDIEPIFRNARCPAANVFDTQICAGFIGLAYPVALSKLVQELLGVRLGKGLTFTHWDQRPLSPVQLRYAADDVRYLLAVHAHIANRLEELGHAEWAREECRTLCDPAQYGFDVDSYYHRIRGSSSLSPRNLSVLKELTRWRDACAREENIPARTFVRDEVLLDLARSPVKTVEKLDRVRGIPRPLVEAMGEEIVELISEALAKPAEQLPQTRDTEPTPTQRFGADSLFAAVQCLSAGQAIDPALVSSRQEIGELYYAIANGAQLPDLRFLRGWRRAAVGQATLDLLAGKVRTQMQWSQTLKTATIPSTHPK